MSEILLLIVPPLAGALIGFVTNVLAIKMLFRPLKPCYMFGIRIPFTPGILPRERARLAQSIGAMVERELLTPEILRERLAGAELREKVRQALSRYTRQIPALFTGAAERIYPHALNALVEFLRKPEIHEKLTTQGREIVDSVIAGLSPIQRLLISSGQFDRGIKENMPAIVDDLIARLEKAGLREDVRSTVISCAGDSLFAQGALDRALKDLLSRGGLPSPGEQADLDSLLTEKLLQAADAQIESFLTTIDVRNMVRSRIDSMDMLRVEGIILDVMANQFKWIDIFGAILGFLIGLFQALFAWGMRS
ncbi:MAG: DUF445 family protein [Treponema sp.]|jgi:uncharacterized membrane-anchored protein YjiN (DUF445 family)|nr:DUF445 family protein [Treponema sp.]